MPGVLLWFLACQAHRDNPHPTHTLTGVLLCRLSGQALKGTPCILLCSSVRQAFDGQPLYCSAANAGVRGREATVMGSTPYT